MNSPKKTADDKEARFAEQPVPVCHLCNTTDVGEDDHCAGCGVYICDVCDMTSPMGSHDPMDHVDLDDEDGDDDELWDDDDDLDEDVAPE